MRFDGLWKFLPQSVWDSMVSGSVAPLMDHLIKLGLRNPSEQTFQEMSIVMLFQSEGQEVAKVTGMTIIGKLSFLKTVKQECRIKCKAAPPPVEWVGRLPSSVHDFRSDLGTLFRHAFGSAEPAACPFSELDLAQMKAGFKMRETKQPQQLWLAGQTEIAAPQMMQFGAAMVTAMQSLTSEIASMRGSQSSGSGGAPPGFRMLLPVAPPKVPRVLPLPPPPLTLDAGAADNADEDAGTPEPPKKALKPLTNDEKRQVEPKSVAAATAEIARALDKSGPAKGKRKAKAKAKSKTKGKACAEIIISHEKSRSQYLARTVPSKTFKYSVAP